MRKSIHILFILGMILSSCNEEFQAKLQSVPNALGTANEIVVISDNPIWDGDVGDSLRYFYETAYPMMPAPEPIFNLRHFTPAELEEQPLRKELRTYLFVADLNDNASPTTKMVIRDIGEQKYMDIRTNGSSSNVVGRDKWAMGQIMIYMAGKNNADLINNLKNSFSSISKRVYDHDYEQLHGYTFASGYNRALSNEIRESIGVEIEVPGDYIKALYNEEEKLFWIRKETAFASFSQVFQVLDYKNQEQLSIEFLKEKINEFGKKYVDTETPGSYMVINDKDLPIYTNTRDINGQYTFEMRGIWEATKDYMGGPYFAYLIIDKSQKKLLFVYNFLLAPGKQKRDYMQQLELLTNTIVIN